MPTSDQRLNAGVPCLFVRLKRDDEHGAMASRPDQRSVVSIIAALRDAKKPKCFTKRNFVEDYSPMRDRHLLP